MNCYRALLRLSLALCVYSAAHADSPAPDAAGLRAFQTDSVKAIRESLSGQPFVMALWSVYCEPCREELETLQRFKAAYPQVAVVLIATDPPEDDAAIRAAMADFDLSGMQTWAFADAFAEPLRYAVDPRWRGELPRTYLFDEQHRSSAVSGRVDRVYLDEWIGRLPNKR
ncbi:MAG: TlpA family protein disulfide reductase [Lysobacterales bacterium]